jgi:hypothetical protein
MELFAGRLRCAQDDKSFYSREILKKSAPSHPFAENAKGWGTRIVPGEIEKQIPLRGMTERKARTKATARTNAKAEADSPDGKDRKKSKNKSRSLTALTTSSE